MSATNVGADNKLEAYRSSVLMLHESLSRALGRETVDSIFERALVEIAPAYRRLDGTERANGHVVLDSIGAQLEKESEDEVRAAFSALYAAILVLLAHTVGKEVVLRLAASPDARAVMDGEQLGRG